MSNLFNQQLGNFPATKKFGWQYLLIALGSAIAIIFMGNQWDVRLSDVLSATSNVPYLVIIFYTLMPIVFVWSLVEMFTGSSSNKSQTSLGFLDLPSQPEQTVPLEIFLYHLEQNLIVEAEKYKKIMNRGEFYGRMFSTLSLVIPGLSWCYVILQATSSDQPPSLGLFGFSSMVAVGTVGITISTTMLRHSKTVWPYIEKISNEINYIKKLRVVCLADAQLPRKDEMMVKVLEALLTRPRDETTKTETKSDAKDAGGSGTIMLPGIGDILGGSMKKK